MNLKELIVLLPCHSLEDFPTHHEGDEAQSLLANWSALWHPALLAAAGAMPAWHRADSPPDELAERLIVVPSVSDCDLPAGFVQRAESQACLIRNRLDRDEIIDIALDRVGPPSRTIAPALVADFLALGYCYLQVELLTRQMRYSSNLDEIHFQNQLVQAATAAADGQDQQAREHLSACFDVLAEERDHYYPVDAYIVDVTMLAPTTIGRSLRDQLQAPGVSNLLLSGDLLSRIAEREPDTLALIRHAIEHKQVGIIGGELVERRLPMLACETIAGELRRGIACYQALLGHRPTAFGRWRFGLTPILPQILNGLGFQAALHATLEQGAYPEGTQAKIRWEGCDRSALDAIGRPPADARRAGAYLNYAVKLGESMDMDHVATMCFAHWPGQTCVWYEDLRRIAQYCSALGKFVTIDEYFRQTDMPVHQDRFRADQYRSPYLRQAVAQRQPDPISTSVRYWRRRAVAEAAQALTSLDVLVRGSADDDSDRRRTAEAAGPRDLLSAIDQQADEPAPEDGGSVDQRLDDVLQAAVRGLAGNLPRRDAPPQAGYLILNPHSFVRRIGLSTPELEALPAAERPVYAASEDAGAKHAVIDVPPMGFAWVAPGAPAQPPKKPEPALADHCLLRNEFFEALIDPAAGALKAIHQYGTRGNRLSQQIALRLGRRRRRGQPGTQHGADGPPVYTTMRADAIRTTIATPALGEIVARGHLADPRGNRLADFQQTYRLWRGSRVLHLEIELEPHVPCQDDPWESYFASRFAWTSEAADLYRAVNQTRQAASAKRLEAPHYIEIDEGTDRTTILTGGLPFHRRQGLRMLDTLLIVRGEQCRKFHLGIGIDLKHPMHEALGLLSPMTAMCQSAAPPSPADASWLFHLDSRNVIATHWEPLVERGRAVGFRARLLETAGRAADAKLSAFRPVTTARCLDLAGGDAGQCPLDQGRLQLHFSAHQWLHVEARW